MRAARRVKSNASDVAGANSSVFSRLWNVGSDGDEVTSAGRLFHTRAAATGNARSPTVDRHVNVYVQFHSGVVFFFVIFGVRLRVWDQ